MALRCRPVPTEAARWPPRDDPAEDAELTRLRRRTRISSYEDRQLVLVGTCTGTRGFSPFTRLILGCGAAVRRTDPVATPLDYKFLKYDISADLKRLRQWQRPSLAVDLCGRWPARPI